MLLPFGDKKKQKRDLERKQLAKDLINGAKKRFKYDPDKDPVIQDFRKKMNDLK
jgi:hypothetical protein